MRKLSIIIPVYNTAPYLHRCLDSCINQESVSISDYEIIVINDGSTDASGKILSEYEQLYPSLIRVYEQSNQGQSVARNLGLKNSHSQYVWFVDSDDWITSDAVSKILVKIVNNPIGIAISFSIVYDNPNYNKDVCVSHDYYTGKELLYSSVISYPAQWFIVRREFLEQNQLQFYENHWHEDVDFSVRVRYLAITIEVVSTPIYYFYQRAISTSRGNKNPKRAFDCLDIAVRLYDFSANTALPEDRHIFGNAIATLINISLDIIRCSDKSTKALYVKKLNERKVIFNLMKHATSKKHKIEAFMLSIVPLNIVVNIILSIRK